MPEKRGGGGEPGNSGLRLRNATPEDAQHLAGLVEAAYGHYVERLGVRPRPMNADYAEVAERSGVTVAEEEGEIVGLIVCEVTAEGFGVDNVAVAPSQQGRGVGRALLEHAEEAALRSGFSSIYLFTHEKMTENLARYARIGYVEFDRRAAAAGRIVYLRKALHPLR